MQLSLAKHRFVPCAIYLFIESVHQLSHLRQAALGQIFTTNQKTIFIMNQKARLFFIFFAMLIGAVNLCAQEETEDSPWNVGADFVSRYIWRGINLGGSSPSLQPFVEYGFGTDDHAFTIGAWGAYSISGTQTGQEADLYLSYSFKEMFSLIVTDYFLPDETVANNSYFNYNMDWTSINNGTKAQTGHVAEVALSFDGTEKIPVSLTFAMNVWGADSRKYENVTGTMVAADKIVMSKYLEIAYSTEIKGIGLDLFAGACLDNPDIANGEPAGFYGQESAGLINLGLSLSKEIPLTEKYAIPISGSLITNPEAQNIFMVFGISF